MRPRPHLFLGFVLAASAAFAEEPLERTHATLTLGSFGVGVFHETATSSDPLFLGAAEGTVLLLDDRLIINGWAAAGLPLREGGLRSAYTGVVRLGWQFERVSFALGTMMNVAPGSPAVGWLPSLTVKARFGAYTGVLGVFDRYGLVPARLGIETKRWGAALLAAYGAEAWGRFPLNDSLSIEARGFAYRLVQLGMIGASVGVRWTPESAR